jgi:hypothetical protein
LEKNIVEWIQRISAKKDELGGFAICPFAKKAFDDQKIFWSYIAYESVEYISRYMKTIPNDYEVVLFFNLGKNLTNDDCIDIIAKLNEKFLNTTFLKDHPNDPGFIQGLNTGNGEYPIILAQPKDKLLKAREKLDKAGYYKFWSQKYKEEIWSYGYNLHQQ